MQRTSCGAAPPSHGSAVCNWSTQCTAEARQALSTILYTPRTQGCSCALCPAQKPEQQPSLHLRAGRDWVLPETLQKVTPHKHPVLCSGQGCAVFHQTPDQLSTRAVLLWVTACLQQNMVRSSVQHCRGNWLSSAASVLAAQHGGRAGERGSSAITWLRCAPGMTHLKKSESNLQQTNYIVKSPSFSVLWECTTNFDFLGFLFIWNDLMSLFSEKNSSGSSDSSLHTLEARPALHPFRAVPRASCSLTECARAAGVGRCRNSEKLVLQIQNLLSLNIPN